MSDETLRGRIEALIREVEAHSKALGTASDAAVYGEVSDEWGVTLAALREALDETE